jgi:hypothetical protein
VGTRKAYMAYLQLWLQVSVPERTVQGTFCIRSERISFPALFDVGQMKMRVPYPSLYVISLYVISL